jgi:hypothetical protein
MLLSIAACAKTDDLGKLQEEGTIVVAKAKPEVDELTRRVDEALKAGRATPPSTPGIQGAGEALAEARGVLEQLRGVVASGPGELSKAGATGVPDNVAAVIDTLREKIERDTRIIHADLTSVETWLWQHPNPATAAPPS